MTTLHDTLRKGKPLSFVGIIGIAGLRQTPIGMAVDVADNRYLPCRWYDLLPRDQDDLGRLQPRMKVLITDIEVIEAGKRPLIRANLEIVTDGRASANGQMRLC